VVAHHLYNGGMAGNDPAPDSFATAMTNVANAASNAGGKPIFMTEFAPQAPSLLNTAWMIQDALTTEGVSAYIYWGLIWAPPSAGAPPAGLVTIAGADPSSPYTINDTYYAMKHFARWTDPEWVRVGAASSVDAVRSSAFVSPDGASLTVVLLNTDSVEHVVSVGTVATFASTTVYRTSGAEERAAAVPYGPDAIPLPASSIATLVLTP